MATADTDSEIQSYNPVIFLTLTPGQGDQHDGVISQEYSMRFGSFTSAWKLTLHILQDVVELTKMDDGEVAVSTFTVWVIKPGQREKQKVVDMKKTPIFKKGQSVLFKKLNLKNFRMVECCLSLLTVIGTFSPNLALLKHLFVTKEHSDLEICTLDGVIKAHKIIIGAVSPVLKLRIDECGIEYGAAQIDMMEFSDDIQQMIIRYAYGELTLPEIKEHSVKLLQAAYIYQIKDLECLCELCLPDISVENVVIICAAAFVCKKTEIFANCCKIIKKNYREVKKQNVWKQVLKNNSSLSTVLMDGLVDVSFVALGEKEDNILQSSDLGISIRSHPDVNFKVKRLNPSVSDKVAMLDLVKTQPKALCPTVEEFTRMLFTEIYQQQLYTDCRIQTESHNFNTHEFVLRHHSPLLAEKLSPDKVLTINDADMVSAVLEIIYLGFTNCNLEKFGGKLLEFGQKYEIQSIISYCDNTLMHYLAVDNVCTIHNLAFNGKMKLLNETTEYIKDHYNEMKETNQISEILYQNKGAMLYLTDKLFDKIEQVQNQLKESRHFNEKFKNREKSLLQKLSERRREVDELRDSGYRYPPW